MFRKSLLSLADMAEIETRILRSRLLKLRFDQNLSLMKQQAAQDRISACYVRACDKLVKQGVLSKSKAEMHQQVNRELTDLQLRPKSLHWHTSNQFFKQHVLDVYPLESE